MHRRSLSPLLILLGFTVSVPLINGTPAHAGTNSHFRAAAPEGFEDLAAERQALLDIYHGGRKVGEASVRLSPGLVTFDDPELVTSLIAEVADRARLARELTGPLPSNVALSCDVAKSDGCGVLEPMVAGVILDENRFRVEIFVNPDLLSKSHPKGQSYLSDPDNSPSFISRFGATISGSSRGDRTWHLQNRTVAAAGSVRLRSDLSWTSGPGMIIDNLTVETDRRDWRLVGGTFWAPGSELTGRRRIVGVGVSTQLDTRGDKIALAATPIEIFLHQSARVELLVDGRLMASRVYPSGHRLVDTEMLPNGSYDVVLRIHEDGRAPRSEQRFFSKGTQLVPSGRPLLGAFAGLIPDSNHGLSLAGRKIFYEVSAAYRLNDLLTTSAAILGTQDKAILESGATLLTGVAQLSVVGLVSSKGDHGTAVRAASAGRGRLSFSFDLRKVKSHDGKPLLPVTSSRGTFSEDPERGFDHRGTYTQALAVVGYNVGPANLRLSGLYRGTGAEKRSYSVGASIDMPVIRSRHWNVVVQGDVRKTERSIVSFLGARFLLNKGSVAVSGLGGVSASGRGDQPTRIIGEAQAAWYRQLGDHSQVSTDVALGRDAERSYARASAYARTPLVSARGDVLHELGESGATQYSATLDGSLVGTTGGLSVAGREMNDAAVVVSAKGAAVGQSFDILVDEVARGTVTSGRPTKLFLQPYESYDIRLRPRGTHFASFDTAAKAVTLYPGNVARLEWQMTPLFVLFGRAVGLDSKPIANANVRGSFGTSQTDDQGYFQIETKQSDLLHVRVEDGTLCELQVQGSQRSAEFETGGEMLCQ